MSFPKNMVVCDVKSSLYHYTTLIVCSPSISRSLEFLFFLWRKGAERLAMQIVMRCLRLFPSAAPWLRQILLQGLCRYPIPSVFALGLFQQQHDADCRENMR